MYCKHMYNTVMRHSNLFYDTSQRGGGVLLLISSQLCDRLTFSGEKGEFSPAENDGNKDRRPIRNWAWRSICTIKRNYVVSQRKKLVSFYQGSIMIKKIMLYHRQGNCFFMLYQRGYYVLCCITGGNYV